MEYPHALWAVLHTGFLRNICSVNANLKTFVGIAFFEPTNTGIQRVDVVFEHQLKSDPVAVIAIYNDTISVADFMGPLNIVIDSITKTGFSVSAKRLQSEYRWMIKYIVYYWLWEYMIVDDLLYIMSSQ